MGGGDGEFRELGGIAPQGRQGGLPSRHDHPAQEFPCGGDTDGVEGCAAVHHHDGLAGAEVVCGGHIGQPVRPQAPFRVEGTVHLGEIPGGEPVEMSREAGVQFPGDGGDDAGGAGVPGGCLLGGRPLAEEVPRGEEIRLEAGGSGESRGDSHAGVSDIEEESAWRHSGGYSARTLMIILGMGRPSPMQGAWASWGKKMVNSPGRMVGRLVCVAGPRAASVSGL